MSIWDKDTVSGKPAKQSGPAPDEVDPATGQHKDHWVLPEEERAKGFVRPVRDKYVHRVCGVATRMPQAIAETYARNPDYYGQTFCCGCKGYFPVREFVWDGTEETVGS